MPRTPAGETRTTFLDDADLVLSAIRLGWYVAEVSGRNNPDCPQPCAGQVRKDIPSPLPLRNERTADELEAEAEGVLAPWRRRCSPRTARPGRAASRLPRPRCASRRTRRTPRPCGRPGEIHLRDGQCRPGHLTAISDTQACGYLLCRGLAECYWALDLKDLDTSWPLVLGEERVSELTRLAGRQSDYFDAYTASAVAGTLAAWHVIAEKKKWRDDPDVVESLFLQVRRW